MSYVYVLYACLMCMSYVHACDKQCKRCPPIDRSIGVCYIPMPNPKGVLCLSVTGMALLQSAHNWSLNKTVNRVVKQVCIVGLAKADEEVPDLSRL